MNPKEGLPTAAGGRLKEMPSKTNINVSKLAAPLQQMKIGSAKNANFPMDDEGRVYHIGVKRGEVANRILTVGDPRRAERLAACFDDADKVFKRASNRGFVIYTGRKKNVPLSIIAIGMGISMADFLVREARAIVEGPLIIIRFGTCGCLDGSIPIGSVVVANPGSVLVRREPDAFRTNAKNGTKHYSISHPVESDRQLSELTFDHLKKGWGETRTFSAMNASADSFYGSQGRDDAHFNDHNKELLKEIQAAQPLVKTLEMETFVLLDLAESCNESIRATAACLVLANRLSNEFLDNARVAEAETIAGRAIIQSLIEYPLAEEELMNDVGCVWNMANPNAHLLQSQPSYGELPKTH